MNLIYYFLLLVSIVLAVTKSSLYNSYAKKNNPSLCSLFHFNAISYGAAAIIALVGVFVARQSISFITVVCAFFYAAIVISLQSVSIIAMSVGAMSTTSICVMYGMIIPAVAGPIFWGEPISALGIFGMLLMIVSLWLIKDKVTVEKSGISKKWIALAITAFLLSGMAGVMEKIHQSTSGSSERLPFVFVASVFMLGFSFVAIPVTRKTEKGGISKSILPIAALSGLVVGFYSTVNLILAGGLDSMIYYPVANGGAMLLTVTASIILFKERFEKKRIIGVIMGLLGILLLSLPV